MCFSNTKSKQRDRALRGSYARIYDSGVMAQEPAGLLYQPDFMSAAQERLLVADRAATFSEVRMHGVTAKRRVAHFGWIREW